MFIPRIAPVAVASVLALALTVPVAAQEESASFTLNLGTCSKLGSVHEVQVAATLGADSTAYDCSEGWDSTVADFTLNGASPDEIMPDTITWNEVAPGDAELVFNSHVPSADSMTVTIDGDTVLWATYYLPTAETPEATETAEPTAEATETPEATATGTVEPTAPAAAVTPEATTAAPELPNTGVGPGAETGTGIALAGLAASALAAAGVTVRRRS